MHATVAGRSIGLHRSSILDPNAVLFSCAAIELVQVNDPEYDVIMVFPESVDFERQDYFYPILMSTQINGSILN